MCPLLAEWHGARWLLYVATHPPGNLLRLDELAFTSTFTVRPVLTLLEDIERTLRLHGVFSIQAVTPIALLWTTASDWKSPGGGALWPASARSAAVRRQGCAWLVG